MELHYTRPYPRGAAYWGFVALALLIAGGIYQNPHLAILALAPAMLALGLLLGRPRDFHGRLTEKGLEVDQPELKIPYSEIEGLTINRISVDPDQTHIKSGALMVTHRHGFLEIPAGLNVPIQKVYQAIFSLMPTTGSYQLSPQFSDHVRKETETFGNERVHAFSKRTIPGRRCSTRRGRICAALLFLCGIIWIIVYIVARNQGIGVGNEAWAGVGSLLAISSALAWILLYSKQTYYTGATKRLKEAELVVSPTGIAVKQGDIQGHLLWEELLDVKFLIRPPVLTITRASLAGSIELVIAGAKIHLLDVYDRPMALIHKLIRRYWKNE